MQVLSGVADTHSVLRVESSGSGRADLQLAATGTGDAGVWLDAANGDFSGADYAAMYHSSVSANLNIVNYANGLEFYVRSGTLGAGGLDKSIECHEDGAVDLYYNGSKKFETTSAGGKVSGYLLCERNETALQVYCSSAGDVTGSIFRHNRGGLSGYSGKMISFRGNDDTEEGSIHISQSATSYGTSSDYRLKENQVNISDGITRLKQLKPYRFNFKKYPDTTVDGFFAHEVTPTVPEAITGDKDATNSDGSIKPQNIDQSKLVPLLTAALQEAITKIETLETKVAALEAK